MKRLASIVDLVNRRILLMLAVSFMIFGFVFSLLLPPFWAPDEASHWLSSLSNYNELVGEPRDTPALAKNWPDFYGWHVGKEPPRGKYSQVSGGALNEAPLNYGTYGGLLAYPGPSLAYFLTSYVPENGRVVLLKFYLARVLTAGLIAMGFWVLFSAMRRHGKYPFGMLIVLTLLLGPLVLQQSFSLTADAPILAFSLLLAILVATREGFGITSWIIFALVGYFAATSKSIVVPMIIPLCFFASANKGWKAQLKRDGYIWIAVALTVIAIGTTLGQADLEQQRSANAMQQVTLLKTEPLRMLELLWISLPSFFEIKYFINQKLGWFDVPLAPQNPATLFVMIRVAFALEILWLLFHVALYSPRKWVDWKEKWQRERLGERSIWFVLSVGGIYASGLLICVAMLIAWTPVDSPRVGGLQLRYFIPHVICLYMCIAQFIQFTLLPQQPAFVRVPRKERPMLTLLTIGIGLGLVIYSYTFIFTLADRFY